MINVTKTDLPEISKYVEYLEKIWSTRWVTNNGELVQSLEKKLEEFLGVKNLLVVNNGTSALQLPLKALDLKGEVITTPFTFAATTNAIVWEGLTPIFADINPDTYNIDPGNVEEKITDKTSAILAVHVYGNPCYVSELQEIADKHGLQLIYDAAHAFAVQYDNRSVLSYGAISTLSFHATKIFHTIEGGAIIVKDDELFEKLKLLRNFGIASEEKVLFPGINAKMTEFQAAMGLCNLEHLNEHIIARKRLYEHYKAGLNNNIKYQNVIASEYNYGYMPVCFSRAEKRDEVYAALLNKGIKSRKYFHPLTANFDYFVKNEDLVSKFRLKNASDISNRILCLPLYHDLEVSSVDKIIEIVNNCCT